MASFITAGNATNGLQVSSDNTGILELRTGTGSGTTAVTVNASQNVGIGTSSPSSRLDVRTSAAEIGRFSSSATNGGFQIFYPDNVTTPVYVGSQKAILGTGNATDFAIVGTGVNNMVFGTASVERARIDSSGNLLVGTTTATAVLTALAPSGNNVAGFRSAGAVTNTRFVRFDINAATEVGSIQYNGTGTSYVTTSDYRLKENIQPLTGALEKISFLKPCTYTWKETGEQDEGFIAHELGEVCPRAVSGEKDEVDADGNPKYQGIDTSFLVATLTAAIQEQQQMIETLQAKVAALEGA